MKRTKPRRPQAMLKNPTIQAVIAPEVERDFFLLPFRARYVADRTPIAILVGPNGFILSNLIEI